MSVIRICVAIVAATIGVAMPAALRAASSDGGAAVARATPTPRPSSAPPLTIGGFVRSYYFTRQNASDNPGVQSVFQGSPPVKYNANAVNQASWNTAVAVHADYRIPGTGGLFAGASYYYANPMDGACAVAANHTGPGAAASNVVPACNKQLPPALNPDDTLPGFALSTLYEAYVAFANQQLFAKIGDQLFNSPWVNPADVRLKPASYQGVDAAYRPPHWSVEAADITAYENRTSSTFGSSTLLTSYPAGNPGLPANLATPKCFNTGCTGFSTPGFFYGKAAYGNAASGLIADGYFYGIVNLDTIWWFDGAYQIPNVAWQPYLAVQGGTNANAGASYLGKIDSHAFGIKIGAYAARNLQLSLGMDVIPWKTDAIVLPKGVSCSSSGATPSYQIKTATGSSLQYFLPTNAAQCSNNNNGTTNVYYGGWASPYTDAYGSDPFFTTSGSQGMTERRAGGTSLRAVAVYTSNDRRLILLASDAWYDYGNAGAPEFTKEWDLDAQYHFNGSRGPGSYRGFLVRDRYQNRTISGTYYPAGTTAACQALTPCSQLGGLPLFKYNRVQLEYDF